MDYIVNFRNYTPVVDVCTFIMCVSVFFLMKVTYSARTRRYRMLVHALASLGMACLLRIGYHELAIGYNKGSMLLVFEMRALSYIFLIGNMTTFCVYLDNLFGEKKILDDTFSKMLLMLQIIFSMFQIVEPLIGFGCRLSIGEYIYETDGINSFKIAYVVYNFIILGILIKHRRIFVKKMYNYMGLTLCVCWGVLVYEQIFSLSTFTTFTFLLPLVAVLLLFHYNTYDPVTGTLDAKSYDSYIKDLKDCECTMIFVHIFDTSLKKINSLVGSFFENEEMRVDNTVSFRLNDDKVCIVYEQIFSISTFTTFTFLLPLVAVLLLFHYNTYDPVTGMLDAKSYDSYIKDIKDWECTMIFVHIFDTSLKKINSLVGSFFENEEVRGDDTVSFRLNDDKVCIVYENNYQDVRKKVDEMTAAIKTKCDMHHADYKIVIIDSNDMTYSGEEYLYYVNYIEEKISMDGIYECNKNDIKEFKLNKYITSELHDIYKKRDLNDKRVLLYAQPVYHIPTKTYNTAEALMRLRLPDIGIVMPEYCIPIAEKNEYVHVINLIILNKACKYINECRKNGNILERISVNFSISELQEKNFASDVIKIIEDNKIPYNKIAIELTETQKENDFSTIQKVMLKLQSRGIKFYLDDFGTSYSNFERIMELPIDIIKFDRSMTVLSGKDDNSRLIVGTMANLFEKTDFKILYEGVENLNDEERCLDMSAQYLQGFKYSRPLPIFELADFVKNNTVFS